MLFTPRRSTHYALRMFMALFLPFFSIHTADRINHKSRPGFSSPYHGYIRKKRLPSPVEQVAEQQHVSEDDDTLFIPFSFLEQVHRVNKEGDPLIDDYDRQDSTKQYHPNDCLAFFVRLKKSTPDADMDGGIITASYFFYPQQYVCSVYRPHNPNGKLQQYLANDTFDLLKKRFEAQEKIEKALKKLADKQLRDEEFERNGHNLYSDITVHVHNRSTTQ